MGFNDVHSADRARFFKILRENLPRFRRENISKINAATAEFRFQNIVAQFLEAAHDEPKMNSVFRCDFLGCATPKARDRRVLREKLQRFQREKI